MLPKSLDTLRIDINSGKVRKSVAICQQDNVQRTLNFQLVDSGNALDMSNLLFAEILIHKADGYEADNGCVIDGDSVQYTLRSTDVAALGTNLAQLQLTFENGQVLTTPTFEIVVYSKVLDQRVQTSMNEYTALTQQLVQVNELKNEAQGYVSTAETAAQTATTQAENASTSATEAAESEDNALDYAERAEEAYRKMGEKGLVLGETASTAYRGDRGKTAYDHSQTIGNPHATTYTDVGADQAGAAAAAYQQAAGYTDLQIANLINGAPQTLDTLKEIADAMADDHTVVEALQAAIGDKADEADFEGHVNNDTIHITANERAKWNTVPDAELSSTSTNSVQNKVVTQAINQLDTSKVYKPSNRPVNAVTDLLYVAIGDNDAEVNQPSYFSTDAGTLTNIPPGVSSTSAFYGWREVHCVMSLTTVTLHELYPYYGRIYINTYDTNLSTWYGWRHIFTTS